MLAATLPYYVRTVRHDPSQLIQPHHNIENEALRLDLTLLLGRLLEMGIQNNEGAWHNDSLSISFCSVLTHEWLNGSLLLRVIL